MSARDDLLRSLARLARDGEDPSPSRLAREAGVSRATVRRHLGTRADIARLAQAELGLDIDDSSPRDRLLDAVDRLVRSGAIVEASLQDVADEAGVGVATLYRHFGDRRGLLLGFAAERSPRAMLPGVDPRGPLRPQLEHLATEGLRFLLNHRGLLRVWASGDEQLRAVFAEVANAPRTSRRVVAELLDAHELRPGDTEQRVAMLLGSLAGLALINPDAVSANPETHARAVVDDLLRAWSLP